MGGIARLYPRNVQHQVGHYDAESRNSGFQVARELSAKGIEGLDLEIVEVTLNRLRLKVR